jgi:hypothetical protein
VVARAVSGYEVRLPLPLTDRRASVDPNGQRTRVAKAHVGFVIPRRYLRERGDDLQVCVLWDSIALASIVGLIVMAYAYLFPAAVPR